VISTVSSLSFLQELRHTSEMISSVIGSAAKAVRFIKSGFELFYNKTKISAITPIPQLNPASSPTVVAKNTNSPNSQSKTQ
jgi:hypothetical protein